MRYILIRFKGEPTEQRPCGMDDIMSIGEYQSLKNATRYLWDYLLLPPRPSQISGTDLLKVLGEKGYTHFGIYEVPNDYGQPDKLVKKISNPWAFLAEKEKTP